MLAAQADLSRVPVQSRHGSEGARRRGRPGDRVAPGIDIARRGVENGVGLDDRAGSGRPAERSGSHSVGCGTSRRRRLHGLQGAVAPIRDRDDRDIDGSARSVGRGGRSRVGADDYLFKPFSVVELMARVSRETLTADVWDENWFGSTKTLDVHMVSLRRKHRRCGGGSRPRGLARGSDDSYLAQPRLSTSVGRVAPRAALRLSSREAPRPRGGRICKPRRAQRRVPQ
jgi:hypothetical protein